MKYHRLILVFTVAILGIQISSVVLAAGSIYYGPEGFNSPGCGFGTPCRTYGYASSRACALSESGDTPYYIYHTRYGYAGFCDKSGGGGVEPRPEELASVPYSWTGAILSTFSMTIAGLIIGFVMFSRPISRTQATTTRE